MCLLFYLAEPEVGVEEWSLGVRLASYALEVRGREKF
jgi:hypothetical protein